ncbi:MAG TPA: hypothetical protein VMF50_06800 [Candidatus Binataceae bacterium]|nr:hypothetical protein [Candidatus Binataceae bacterium]
MEIRPALIPVLVYRIIVLVTHERIPAARTLRELDANTRFLRTVGRVFDHPSNFGTGPRPAMRAIEDDEFVFDHHV